MIKVPFTVKQACWIAKYCLCQMLFIWAYALIISLIRRILTNARTRAAYFPSNYTEIYLCCTHMRLIKA